MNAQSVAWVLMLTTRIVCYAEQEWNGKDGDDAEGSVQKERS